MKGVTAAFTFLVSGNIVQLTEKYFACHSYEASTSEEKVVQ
jgi:hypothetical protein